MEKLLLNDQEVRSSGGEPHVSDQLSFNEAPFCMSRMIRSKRSMQIAIERRLVRPGDELRGIIMTVMSRKTTSSVEIFHVSLIVGAKLLSLFRNECRLDKFPLQIRKYHR